MTNRIAEVAKLLGVKFGESFEISDIPDGRVHLKWQRCYRLSRAGIEASNDNVHWEKCASELLEWLLMGEIGIKRPWKPEVNEFYFSPAPDSKVLWNYQAWFENEDDYYRLSHGLVFKTEEEAVAVARKMLIVAREEGKND